MKQVRLLLVSSLMLVLSMAFMPVQAADANVDTCDLATFTTAFTSVVTSGGGTIFFNCDGVITFTSSFDIPFGLSITLEGQSRNVRLTGNYSTRLFTVTGTLSIQNGLELIESSGDSGGAIENLGNLNLNGVTLSYNRATGSSSFGTGKGGAILNRGVLNANNVLFNDNEAGDEGGAVYNASGATANFIDTEFSRNQATNRGGGLANYGDSDHLISWFGFNAAGSGAAIFNGVIGTVNASQSNYVNNNCEGVIGDDGTNTATNSPGCIGGGPVTIPLNVSALSCVGDDAQFTINSGDADFSVTGTGPGLPTIAPSTGTYTLTGPATWTNITVTELTGNGQSVNIGGITCPGAVVIPPVISVVTQTVLGCKLDTADGVEIPNTPDDTYCRILMRNGRVVSYSGAVPAQLVNLGVILAVDVYRLQGGMSINTFPNYSRVCLAGSGRLFYMDARQAPRVVVELVTENVSDLTCGWIPAPGTLILTR